MIFGCERLNISMSGIPSFFTPVATLRTYSPRITRRLGFIPDLFVPGFLFQSSARAALHDSNIGHPAIIFNGKKGA